MISYKELVNEHKCHPDCIADAMGSIKETDHLFLYINHMFDSSYFGSMHFLMIGPGRTSDDPKNPPKEIDPFNTGGLPSMREQLIGEVDLEDIRKNYD